MKMLAITRRQKSFSFFLVDQAEKVSAAGNWPAPRSLRPVS
jgi:hypothetical protein